MVANLKDLFSDSAKNMKSSAIRELLKVSQQPEIISFAGGLPAPDLFPVEILKKMAAEVMEHDSALALQYGATEGDKRLREIIVERYRRDGVAAEVKNVIITTASQQSIDIVAKLFLNPGDTVVCELPSYLAALQSFAAYRAQMTGVRRKSELSGAVGKLVAEGRKPKFIYVIPDFQNPSGTTLSLDERKMVLDVAHRYDVLVGEDTPYRELRFEGETLPTLYQLDGTGQVVTLGTFSKIFVPGFRLGWLLADEEIIARAIVAKQAMDLSVERAREAGGGTLPMGRLCPPGCATAGRETAGASASSRCFTPMCAASTAFTASTGLPPIPAARLLPRMNS